MGDFNCKEEEVSEITSEEDPSSEQFTATLSEDNSLPTSLRHHLQELQVDQLSSFSEALLGEVKQLQMGGRGGDILGLRDSTSEEEEPLEEDQVVVPEVKVDGVPVISSPSVVDTSPPPPSPPQAEVSIPGEPQGEAPLEGKASSGVNQDGAAPKEGHTDVSAQQEEAISEGDKAEAHDIAPPPPKHPQPPTTPAEPQDTQDKQANVKTPVAPEPTKVTPATPAGKEVTFKLPSESSSTSATGSEEGPSEATETGADISDFVSFAEENHQEEVCQPAQVVVQEDVPEVVYKAADAPQEVAVGSGSKGISTQTLPATSAEHSTQTEKEREIAVMGLDTSFKREKDVPSVPAEVPEILLDALLPSETQLLVKDTKDTNVEMESSEAGAVPCIVTSHVSLAILGLEGGQPSIPTPVQTSSPSTTDPKTVTTTSTPHQSPPQPPTTIPEQPATTTPEQPATTTPEHPTTTTSEQPATTTVTTTPEQPAVIAPLFTGSTPVVSTITAAQFTKEITPERTPLMKETPKAEGDAVMVAPLFTAPAPVAVCSPCCRAARNHVLVKTAATLSHVVMLRHQASFSPIFGAQHFSCIHQAQGNTHIVFSFPLCCLVGQKPKESPASSKGSSPDMDEYEVITKDDSTTTTTTTTSTSTPSQDATKASAAAATPATQKSGPQTQTQPTPTKPPAPLKVSQSSHMGAEGRAGRISWEKRGTS
ncbi:hypothetical protein E2C01_014484 [Portunus trituberculatus]|uniref:Uncharacterized protein n=1 Tax=Portunus trituberculatus TaxID=210409 RepID=A0A5B7DK17_PORTR|nr:hypothetical protein [Portunus trituberculatus]